VEHPLQRVQLTAQLQLWQRKRGHRTGTDDVMCAWAGQAVAPGASTILDLGAGQGAVGLMLSGVIPHARIVAIEAQEVSYALLQRNVEANALSERFTLFHGDLRETSLTGGPFDLITGTPPFMPLGSGTPPRDPQREAARFELLGGIEGYCAAAAQHLAPDGALVIVMDAARPARYEVAIRTAGLFINRVMEVLPKADQAATYLIYWASLVASSDAPSREKLTVRDDQGQWTEAFQSVRQALNLPS
jgi:tRNA1Val (adenine37-N6)-methyltransferase